MWLLSEKCLVLLLRCDPFRWLQKGSKDLLFKGLKEDEKGGSKVEKALCRVLEYSRFFSDATKVIQFPLALWELKKV